MDPKPKFLWKIFIWDHIRSALSNPLGRILVKTTFPAVCFISFMIFKMGFFLLSVLRSLKSSLESDEHATSMTSSFSRRTRQLTELCLWCSYQYTLTEPHFFFGKNLDLVLSLHLWRMCYLHSKASLPTISHH